MGFRKNHRKTKKRGGACKGGGERGGRGRGGDRRI